MDIHYLKKIISGGQTGIDRAALDFAIRFKIDCGGWCPKGRKAEDGRIDSFYPLSETIESAYPARTRKNIEQGDGTLILYRNKFDAGTGLTLSLCKSLQKPYLVINLLKGRQNDQLTNWIQNEEIATLNIAGPRESSDPGIYQAGLDFLINSLVQAK